MIRAAIFLLTISACCALGLSSWAADSKPKEPTADELEFFEKKIRPIFVEHCQSCHGSKQSEAGLRLDLRAGWEKGGDSGPALRPGKPKESLLIKMVGGRPAKMPPDSVLPEPLIADLTKWVEMGAPDPRTGEVQKPGRVIDWAEARKFWAFQPVAEVQPPAADSRWSQPIDRFLAAKWGENKVQPLEKADRATLLRRVYYTLTGLPPTHAEVAAFVADKSPNAYEKVIDTLLQSPRYGEHQARKWLDLVRYGEDRFSKDEEKQANPWRYRDWVIQAFNDDMPYDRFVKLQIAADLLEQPSDDPRHRAALGLIALGPTYGFVNDNDRSNAEQWMDRIDVLSRGLQGLTVSCARCHDHKYDPIPTDDYYSLAGVLAGSRVELTKVASRQEIEAYDAAKKIHQAAEKEAKDFLQLEIDRRALKEADAIVGYALHAWRWRAQQFDKPELKIEDYAKTKGLVPASLAAMDKYVMREGRGKEHYLHRWRDLAPQKEGPREPTDEVKKIAETFRDKEKENIQQPLASNKRNLDHFQSLFGDKGIFPLTEATILPQAEEGWKKSYESLQQKVKAAAEKCPSEPAQCVALQDYRGRDIQVHLRGNPSKRGAKVPRRFLRIIAGDDAAPFVATDVKQEEDKSPSGRLGLAEAIANRSNPLTARVMVNRIWQQHFGNGIVRSASNFGVLGTPPTHPELLDYLAGKFVAEGWSLKKLHREILRSEAFQRASAAEPANMKVDPENRWLWRMSPRRLTIEEFRDSILAAAGTLQLAGGGPSDNLDDMKTTRRTVFGKVSRKELSKLLVLFDFADPNLTIDKRNESTLPQQMLFVMNSPFVVENAKLLAARVKEESAPAAQIKKVFEFALGRSPTSGELAIVEKYLAAPEPTTEEGAPKLDLTRLERFAQSILAGNEFYYVP